MASKTYTAQEMRELADAIAGDLCDNGHRSVEYTYDDLIPVIESLHQAADAMEKSLEQHDNERRGKKYEYGVRIDGNKIDCDRDYIFESEQYARRVAGDYLQVVRREVGEWEEIRDES